MKLAVVAATRASEQEFWNGTPLGQSLMRLAFDRRIRSIIGFSNRDSLSKIYNACIACVEADESILVVHDDVWLDDFNLCDRLADGLARFDLIGVSGNTRRLPGQPAWCFVDRAWTWDAEHHLSGRIGHGDFPFSVVSPFGPVPAACELLDGVFMALKRSTLDAAGLSFDPRFDFHFYDLDFCRQARRAGLSLGTWPISITHQSHGSFGGDTWLANYHQYLDKWGESEHQT